MHELLGISLIHAACLACNLDDMPVHGSDNSFLRWAATYASDRDHVRERLSSRIVESRAHVAPLVNREVGQRGILIGSLKRNSTDDASSFVREAVVHRDLRTCATAFYGSEIDVNVWRRR